jgi:hypothetical protein
MHYLLPAQGRAEVNARRHRSVVRLKGDPGGKRVLLQSVFRVRVAGMPGSLWRS